MLRSSEVAAVHAPHRAPLSSSPVGGGVIGEMGVDPVRLVLLDDVSRDAQQRLDNEVARLDEFLGGEHITNVFASPQMKHQRLA